MVVGRLGQDLPGGARVSANRLGVSIILLKYAHV